MKIAILFDYYKKKRLQIFVSSIHFDGNALGRTVIIGIISACKLLNKTIQTTS